MSAVVALVMLAFSGSSALAGGCGPLSIPCPPSHVPELDPYTVGAGLAVFGGAAALLIERYRRRKH